MQNLIKEHGRKVYGLKEFVIDTEAELEDLPTGVVMGSKAFVIETNNKYILDGNHKWVQIKSSTTSGGGTSSGGDIIYDGGNEDEDQDQEIIYDGGLEV